MKDKVGTTEQYDTEYIYHSEQLWGKSTYIECSCHSPEHVLVIRQSLDYGDDPAFMNLSFHIQLRPGNIWHRIRNAFNYLLGKKSRYGDYDEIIVEDIDTLHRIAEIANETAEVIEDGHEKWIGERPTLVTWWFDNSSDFWLVGPKAWEHDSTTDAFPSLVKPEGTCNIISLNTVKQGWYIETHNLMRDLSSNPNNDEHCWYGPFNSALEAIAFMRYRRDNLQSGTINPGAENKILYNYWTQDKTIYVEIILDCDIKPFDIEEAKTIIQYRHGNHNLKIIVIS